MSSRYVNGIVSLKDVKIRPELNRIQRIWFRKGNHMGTWSVVFRKLLYKSLLYLSHHDFWRDASG